MYSYNCKYVSSINTNIIVSIHISKIMTNLKSTFYVDIEIQNLISYNYICLNDLYYYTSTNTLT